MSTLFNLTLPRKEKEISHHPWEKTIKDKYANKIKTAHNSVQNVEYPKKKEKEKPVNKDRTKFTIIGNRVTEEFIYCVNLVRGLHTYRKKHFDYPVIRGVTSVEWPLVWNDLKLQYGGIAYCLTSQVAVLVNDKILGGEKELKELIDTKYTYHLSLNYYKESIDQFARYIKGSGLSQISSNIWEMAIRTMLEKENVHLTLQDGRPCIYLHISIDDEHIGTMIFMLYSDVVPYTCENFLRLCKETKGGYSGTPVHRIVKDGWIQCGGFGLKDRKFYCENFIIPPDRRGVLCMANAGRHMECSTQFFVLLQPAPWILHKYVAFGQLIDGESTLQKIENVNTWYESPTSNVIIHRAGILNLDCQDIMINRGAKEYIFGHIEDLYTIGEIFLEELMEKVFLEIHFREIARLEMQGEGGEATKGDSNASVHATERFMRKEGTQEQKLTEKSSADQKSKSKDDKMVKADKSSKVESKKSEVTAIQKPASSIKSEQENNEFDVSMYSYEPEEYSYQQATPKSVSVVVKPEKHYYIALTDCPYPGEVDSEYNLKKFLKGDYCLESDLKVTDRQDKACIHKGISYPSEIFHISLDSASSSESLDSDEEAEIRKYLKMNVDRVSFAGSTIRNIARSSGKYNLFDTTGRPEVTTDEELRRFRIISADCRHRISQTKKISISVPIEEYKVVHKEIKRRQTGFVRPADLEKIHIFQKDHAADVDDVEDEDDSPSRKIRIDDDVMSTLPVAKISRRQTAYVRPGALPSEADFMRQSVLTRLYDDQQYQMDDDEPPTLKDFKPQGESTHNKMMLTQSTYLVGSDDRMDHYRHGRKQESVDKTLDIQHGKKLARKISSDYVKTLDQMQHTHETTLRSLEYAKTRPTMTVDAYQEKNQKYKEELKKAAVEEEPLEITTKKSTGLRLPGDSPLYPSVIDLTY